MGFFNRLKQGLKKTGSLLKTDIRDLFKSEGRLVDDDFLEEARGILFRTDMGYDSTEALVEEIATKLRGRVVQLEEIVEVLKAKLKDLMAQPVTPIEYASLGPTIVMVCGVNGAGKTTSIAKLASQFKSEGKTVLLGAGDTFRAAAVEQLTIWAERLGCGIVTAPQGTHPATVGYQTVERAVAESVDVAIVDTAGRLQTQSDLMAELTKIRGAIQKPLDGAPHEVLLVLDATTGQNGVSQASKFAEAAGCTGIVLAKLDGTAKGGVVVSIRQQMGLPVKYVGLGEGHEDLAPFEPDEFVEALFADVLGATAAATDA
ncbi:unnamed protein product [Cladocopium goreaui]|uniref:Signal recognition particle receptor FtsY (SRP receptor) n=1 Tax=Cladocopium goreaui TaxID=2562237 RepID=A0A9P1G341_9DINO|nr:unnamed protein product [Cladocopium goreaui]